MDFDYHKAAQEMSEWYTIGFSVDDIEKIWRDYSHDLAAGWISHEGMRDENVERVFSRYVKIKDTIYKEI